MDDFRKQLLGFIVGVMIIIFSITCFCLLYYNYVVEEVKPPRGLNKENMEAISSWVSKVSACQPDIITEDILETQPLLLNLDQKAEPPCQENLSMPNYTIKPDEPSSLEKPCIPSNPQNSVKCTNTDKSSMQCSVKTSNRQFDTKRSTKSSNPQRLRESSSLNKSYEKHSLKKSQKLAHTRKLSCSEMQAIPPCVTIGKTSAALATQACQPVSNNQLVSTKPPRRTPNQARRSHGQKKSMSTRKAVLRGKHSSLTFCKYYKEKCLTCNPEFLLKDLAGPKREHAGNPYVSKTVKPFPKSFYEAEYKCKCYEDSNENMKTCESEDSGTEIFIMCDRSHEDDDMAESISTY
ncbi:hypothetical protein LTLLF_207775 [Microtus ochrogaster]|uniref:Uncharacterized protein n=1 Tax=Microtus ochrogaster TaxID=79684 RepID=A0A8J6H0G9_MICOH|nr:hypothetical protein LTLLF_207775 [Microtus ochrogaster]